MNQSIFNTPAHLNCDAYKIGHYFQYPKGQSRLFLNMTPRSDYWFKSPLTVDGVVVWGVTNLVNRYLKDHWNNTFFNRDEDEVVAEWEFYTGGVLGDITSTHIRDLHRLGFLPVVVMSPSEGTVVPIKTPILLVESTHQDFAWVASYLEDVLSNELWKPCTVATIALHYRRLLEGFADETCDNKDHIPYQAHDFALRGMSGSNDGGTTNTGHLLYFKGTDSFPAVYNIHQVYGGEVSDIASSIPATEHTVMMSNIAAATMGMSIEDVPKWCKDAADNSEDAFRCYGEYLYLKRLMIEIYPVGLFSAVMDTFNYFRNLTVILPKLKEEIMQREGKVVVRPDSGNPLNIICGYKVARFSDVKEQFGLPSYIPLPKVPEDICKDLESEGYDFIGDELIDGSYLVLDVKTYEVDQMSVEEIKGSLELLWKVFGGAVNSKGYRVLDPHIGLIYGDSITLERADEILSRMKEMGFASSNVVFGVGSFTYNYMTRDTFGFAVKATATTVNGEMLMLAKEPKTDNGVKKSAKGYITATFDVSNPRHITMEDTLTREEWLEAIQDPRCIYRAKFFQGVADTPKYNGGLNTTRKYAELFI